MKNYSILFFAALFSIATSCGNNSGESKDTSLQSEEALNTTSLPDPGAAPAPAANTPTAEPPQNASGVWHYTCPKGCAGGAGAATPCPTCGTALTHNQTYHGANPAATPKPAAGAPPGTTGQAPITMPNPSKNEPPQNAAGVWHYICPAGCAGGGGAAGPCAKCGKTLEHNKAYH
ncbi:MAG: hypothetical protein ACKVT2_20295 [Saprospiraceae bacterium]